MILRSACVVAAASLSLVPQAAGDEAGGLSFDLAESYASPSGQPETQPDADAPVIAAEPAAEPGVDPAGGRLRYGQGGGMWWTVGSGIASDFGDSVDANLHVAWSWFLADEVEWGIEVAGWGFFQEGDDTGGVSGSLLFRWHFLHDADYSWSVFGDVGIGLLAAFDTVPDTGTGFNFLPRAGFGATFRIDEEADTRLMVGVRWHHISNGRIEGDENNPARDALMIYAGVVFPF